MLEIKDVLIAGIGNVARRDDGAGYHVTDYIIDSGFVLPEYIEVVSIGGAIHDLLPVMMGRKKVVIVDAIRNDDLPGSVYSIPSDELRNEYYRLLRSSPELREIIFQCNIVSSGTDIDFIGIVPADLYTSSMELSPQVKEKIDCAVKEVLKAATCN